MGQLAQHLLAHAIICLLYERGGAKWPSLAQRRKVLREGGLLRYRSAAHSSNVSICSITHLPVGYLGGRQWLSVLHHSWHHVESGV